MEDTLRDICDITYGWSQEMPDKEKLAHIQALAEDALMQQHVRSRTLKKMTREAQEMGFYDE